MIKRIKQLLCKHKTLWFRRAHAQSTYAREHSNFAWLDHHDCFNYIECSHCGKHFDFDSFGGAVIGEAEGLAS